MTPEERDARALIKGGYLEKLEDYDDGDPADDVDWQDPTEAALYTKTYVVPAAKRNRLAKVI